VPASKKTRNLYHLLLPNLNISIRFDLLQALSRAVIHPNSASAGSAVDLADPTAAAVTASKLVPDLLDDLSLALLTNAVLYSLNLGSPACLLPVYLSYSPSPFFLAETVLAFLTSCSFLYPAIL